MSMLNSRCSFPATMAYKIRPHVPESLSVALTTASASVAMPTYHVTLQTEYINTGGLSLTSCTRTEISVDATTSSDVIAYSTYNAAHYCKRFITECIPTILINKPIYVQCTAVTYIIVLLSLIMGVYNYSSRRPQTRGDLCRWEKNVAIGPKMSPGRGPYGVFCREGGAEFEVTPP